MTITVSGLRLYRPSVDISSRYIKDGDGDDLSRRSNITINDIVFAVDVAGSPSGLAGVYNDILQKCADAEQFDLSYPGSISGEGRIKSVSCTSDSDFINFLNYSITIDAVPDKRYINLNNYTETYSTDNTYDINRHIIYYNTGAGVQTGIFYSKPRTSSYNLQFSVEPTRTGIPGQETALEKADKFITNNIVPKFSGTYITSLTKGCSSDGSVSIAITTSWLPSDSSGNVIVNREFSRRSNLDYDDLTSKISFSNLGTALGSGYYVVSGDPVNDEYVFSVTGEPIEFNDEDPYLAFKLASGVLRYYIENSGFNPGSSILGAYQNCPQYRLAPQNLASCWNTRSVALERNLSNRSASVTVQQTTQNIGNCDYNGYKIDFDITYASDGSRYVEPKGWSTSGYFVQDINTYGSTARIYTINVESVTKCAPARGTGIIGFAHQVFSGIDLMSGTGNITDHNITVNNNSCTLKITQYADMDKSYTGIGWDSGVLQP